MTPVPVLYEQYTSETNTGMKEKEGRTDVLLGASYDGDGESDNHGRGIRSPSCYDTLVGLKCTGIAFQIQVFSVGRRSA